MITTGVAQKEHPNKSLIVKISFANSSQIFKMKKKLFSKVHFMQSSDWKSQGGGGGGSVGGELENLFIFNFLENSRGPRLLSGTPLKAQASIHTCKH